MPNWRPLCQSLIPILVVASIGLSALGNSSAPGKNAAKKAALVPLPAAENSVLSFKEWKSKKVSAAIDELVRLRRSAAEKGQLDQGPEEVDGGAEAPSSNRIKSLKAQPISEGLKAQLNQAKINLDVVRELSATDYFALYLTQQDDRENAFAEAAKKLDDSELAEILLAYDKHLRQSDDRIAGQ